MLSTNEVYGVSNELIHTYVEMNRPEYFGDSLS